jgi:hypothetical protein
MHLPPNHQSARLDKQIQRICVIACPVAQGEAEAATQQPVRADDERQQQEDRQRCRQTGGGYCCAQTEQQKLFHVQKGILDVLGFIEVTLGEQTQQSTNSQRQQWKLLW